MGLLTGPEIARRRYLGHIVIDPFDAKRLNSNSYNLRLDKQLLVYDLTPAPVPSHHGCRTVWVDERQAWNRDHTKVDESDTDITYVQHLDMAKENPTVDIEIQDDGYVLMPGRLYLGSTIEKAGSAHYIPMVEGRSSIGRLGMTVHVTAGFGDQGFISHWTLEITVVHPLRVYAGVEVCQIAFHEAIGEPNLYVGKYKDQVGPKASGLWKEFTDGKYKS